MRKCQYLLFVLKRSYICYYIICMTVPLIKEKIRDASKRFLNVPNKKFFCILSKTRSDASNKACLFLKNDDFFSM